MSMTPRSIIGSSGTRQHVQSWNTLAIQKTSLGRLRGSWAASTHLQRSTAPAEGFRTHHDLSEPHKHPNKLWAGRLPDLMIAVVTSAVGTALAAAMLAAVPSTASAKDAGNFRYSPAYQPFSSTIPEAGRLPAPAPPAPTRALSLARRGRPAVLLASTSMSLTFQQQTEAVYGWLAWINYKVLQMMTLPAWGKLLTVLFVGVPILTLGSFILRALTGLGFKAALLRCYFILNNVPGVDIANEADPRAAVVLNLMYTVGLLTFAALIGVIGNDIGNAVEAARLGNSSVVERNHTVVLGYNRQLVEVLRQVAHARADRGAAAFPGQLVVLSDKARTELESILVEALGPAAAGRVVTRQGSPLKVADLQRVSAGHARTVIMLAPEPTESQNSGTGQAQEKTDAVAMAAAEDDPLANSSEDSTATSQGLTLEARQSVTLAALYHLRQQAVLEPGSRDLGSEPQTVVIQHNTDLDLLDPDIFMRVKGSDGGGAEVVMMAKHQVTPVSRLNSLSRLQAQCTSQPGISVVMGNIMRQQRGTQEFYVQYFPEVAGLTYGQARRIFPRAILCGLYGHIDANSLTTNSTEARLNAPAQAVVLNPPDSTPLLEQTSLILLADCLKDLQISTTSLRELLAAKAKDATRREQPEQKRNNHHNNHNTHNTHNNGHTHHHQSPRHVQTTQEENPQRGAVAATKKVATVSGQHDDISAITTSLPEVSINQSLPSSGNSEQVGQEDSARTPNGPKSPVRSHGPIPEWAAKGESKKAGGTWAEHGARALKVVVLVFNEQQLEELLEGLADYCPPGSKAILVAAEDIAASHAPRSTVFSRLHKGRRQLTVLAVAGDPRTRRSLLEAGVQDADAVILTGLEGTCPDNADAQALATLIQLQTLMPYVNPVGGVIGAATTRDAKYYATSDSLSSSSLSPTAGSEADAGKRRRERALLEGPATRTQPLNLVCSVIDPRIKEIMSSLVRVQAVAGGRGVAPTGGAARRQVTVEPINPDEMLAGVLTQVAAEPRLAAVFHELSTGDGVEINLRTPAALELPYNQPVTWDQVQDAGRQHGVTVIGLLQVNNTAAAAAATAAGATATTIISNDPILPPRLLLGVPALQPAGSLSMEFKPGDKVVVLSGE
ncbi:hypothetical protein VaNZ11_009744 [Volvox africanus]|uniref:CASTOR/POLLUX/SYM8 ion channel conserved domain-containing protein n=1 Tax=Volvox africanus TaxID=51714 RepID=A0ABQ5S9M1_9CHLO|nr:hypothetical protein VaNZ11_009744 [Volvox africanus]